MKIVRAALFIAATFLIGGPLASPASAALEVGGVSLRPNVAIAGTYGDYGDHGDPGSGTEFVEPIADLCYAPQARGGTVQVQLLNPGRAPVTIDGVTLDGEPVSALSDRPDDVPAGCALGDVRWSAVTPNPVPAGGAATITLNGRRFVAGRSIRLGVDTSAGTVHVARTLKPPPMRIGAIRISPNLRTLKAFVEPTASKVSGLAFAGASINGRPVRARVAGGLRRGARTLIRMPLADVHQGDTVAVALRFKHGRRTVRVLASQRALPSRFKIGIGVGFGLSNLPEGEQATQLRDAGISTLVAYDQPFSFEQLLDAAHRGGFKAIVGAHIPESDQTHADTAEQLLSAIPDLKSDSSIVGWIPYDEPDIPFAEPVWRYRTSQYVSGITERMREADPSRPTFLNLWSPNAASEYGPIADVGGWDHYILDRAPLALESARELARSNGAAVSPSPFWMWNQALPYGQERVPSAKETRVYTTLGVGHGASGVLWFSYDGQNEERPLWSEMSAESRTLAALASNLRSSVAWPEAARASEPKIDTSTVVGGKLALLTVANLDYQLGGKTPSVFTPRSGVRVDWRLPRWMSSRRDLVIAEVTPGEPVERIGRAKARQAIRVAPFESARWYVAAPRQTISKLTRALG